LVIGGGVALIFKKPTKRKAGQRAGMTRVKIVDAAVKLWDSAGPEGFTIRKLALQLGAQSETPVPPKLDLETLGPETG